MMPVRHVPCGVPGVPRPRRAAARVTWPRLAPARPRAEPLAGKGKHWTDKLPSAEAEDRDPTAQRDAAHATFRADLAQKANENNAAWNLVGVVRDRDNCVLVRDLQMAVPFVAQAKGVSEDEAVALLSRLQTVVPQIENARAGMLPVPLVLRFVDELPTKLAQRVIALRTALPSDVNVALLLEADPQVLHEDPDDVASAIQRLKALFPTATGRDGVPGVDRMVRRTPQLLDADFAEAAVEKLQSAYGGDAERAAEAVHIDPTVALQVESAALRSNFGFGSWLRRHKGADNDPMYSSHKDRPATSLRGHAVDPTRVFY